MLVPKVGHNILAEWSERLVWARAPHTFPMIEGEPIPLVGRHEGLMNARTLKVLDEREIPYQFAMHTSDLTGMIIGVECGIGMMVLPERTVPASLVVARERILPELPEMRFGVFCKEGFDLVRHKALVSAFISAVQPPSKSLAKLLNARSAKAKAFRVVR
jgi:DNA-binding transcriptional LysR family regulator